MPGTPKIALAASLAGLVMVLGACGDDEEATTSPTTASTTTTTGPTTTAGELCAESAIDETSGEFEGDPDCREGTPPPPVETADLEEAADAAGCDLKLDLPDERELALKGDLDFDFKIQSNGHVVDDEVEPAYQTSPPTSGVHADVPLADGAFLDTPRPVNYVHSLEHGRVEIQYSPDLPEDEQLALKGVFDEDPDGMILFPNPDMPYSVAATAWTNLLGCDEYTPETLDAIQAFRDEFRGNGPEAIPL